MCFPEAANDKYKWITDPFHVDSSQNYDFSLSWSIFFSFSQGVRLSPLGTAAISWPIVPAQDDS
jgi:hypothetical protein